MASLPPAVTQLSGFRDTPRTSKGKLARKTLLTRKFSSINAAIHRPGTDLTGNHPMRINNEFLCRPLIKILVTFDRVFEGDHFHVDGVCDLYFII